MNKKDIRLTIDILMTIILPMLMAYSLIGEKFHEIAGTMMFCLFVVHNMININWYKTLFKGKYTPRRFFQTIINILLVTLMISQIISGILMSKHLYTFIKVTSISSSARTIHMLCAYWGYVILCIHAGTHMISPLTKLSIKNKNIFKLLIVLISLISIYGIYAFIKRGFVDYMLMKTMFAYFDYNEPRIYFFLDYLAIMLLFMNIGYICMHILRNKK